MNFLDHQFMQVIERVSEMLFLATAPGRHVLEDRLLTQIKSNDLGHETVHRLVIGDTRANRIGKRQIACLISRHQTRYSKRGVGAEGEWIDEVVINAPVDNVNAPCAVRMKTISSLTKRSRPSTSSTPSLSARNECS